MKNLANCKPSEFLRQTNKIRRAAEKWLKITDIMEIRKTLPELPEDISTAERKEAIAKQGQENFKYDMAVTKGTIKELKAERKARIQEKREKRIEELEENSEILKQNFTK